MGNMAAIKEDLCPAGPIVRTDPKFFKNKGAREEIPETWEGEDESGEDWEHLGITPLQRIRHVKQRSKKTKSFKAGSMRGSMKSLDHRKSQPSKKFDHEVSFADVAEDREEGDHHSSGSRARERGKDSPLLQAIKRNQVGEINRCLKELPESVNEEDRFQQTPIFYVSAWGDMEALQTLLDYSAEVRCANKFGYTPLMRALRHGKAEVAEELLRYHADVASEDKHLGTPLQLAAACGQVSSVDWLLGHAAAIAQLEHHDVNGVTPLQAAVREGHSEVCRLLLEARARPDCADETGRTPLLFALARSDVDMAHHLIGHEADVNAEDESGRSVVMCLVENAVKHKARKDIREATLSGLDTVLASKADPDSANDSGFTPLLVAARHDESLICAILAAYSADVTVKDEQDRTALSYTRKKGFVDVSKVLTEFGAVRIKKNQSLNRTLLRAAFYGNMDACKNLLERGADATTTQSKEGKFVAQVALNAGNSGVYRALKDQLEAEKCVDTGSVGMKDQEVLQAWLKELRESGSRFQRIQHGARSNDPDVIISAAQELVKKKPPPEDELITAVVLSGFLRNRKTTMLNKAKSELRKLRSRERRGRMVVMAKELEEWDRARTQERADLMRIAGNGVSQIKHVKVSSFELEDKYTERLEDFQAAQLKEPLQLATELPALYQEVTSALETFPGVEPEELLPQELQCPKCLITYGSEAALDKHVKFCHSTMGEDKQEAARRRRRAKAESAVFQLLNATGRFLEHSDKAKTLVDKVKKARKDFQKEFPEAVPCLQGIYVMLQALQRVYASRARVTEQYAKESAQMWGIRKEAPKKEKKVNKYCLKCFVKDVDRAVRHRDNAIKPHRCLCAPCAFELSLRVKAGRLEGCPECGEPIRDFMVSRTTDGMMCA